MKFVNLTPHDITVVVNGNKIVFPKTNTVARCKQHTTRVDTIDGINIFATRFGDVTDLPPAEKETIYIVSALVKDRVSNRTDIVSPGNLIRDEKGVVIGCEGFNI